MDLDDEELKATRMMNGADRNSRVRVNNDIEVNEYVRTNKGNIGKVVEIRLGFNKDTQLYQNVYMLDNGLWTILEYIVKHGKQLIDLVENKDILKVRIYKTIMFFGIDESTSDTKYKEIIKSIENGECELLEILTHQQFEANCYKVGEEDE
jgi:hypothetical protein